MKLPTELELCEQFGVSRTVLREALRMLSARGLVVIQRGRGMFVSQITADTVANTLHSYLSTRSGVDSTSYLVRTLQVMEPPVAALEAMNYDSEGASALKTAFDGMKLAGGDFAELAHLDTAFHLAVATAAGNPLIPLLFEPIRQFM